MSSRLHSERGSCLRSWDSCRVSIKLPHVENTKHLFVPLPLYSFINNHVFARNSCSFSGCVILFTASLFTIKSNKYRLRIGPVSQQLCSDTNFITTTNDNISINHGVNFSGNFDERGVKRVFLSYIFPRYMQQQRSVKQKIICGRVSSTLRNKAIF